MRMIIDGRVIFLLTLSFLVGRTRGSLCEATDPQSVCSCGRDVEADYKLSCPSSKSNNKLFTIYVKKPRDAVYVQVKCDKEARAADVYSYMKLLSFHGITTLKLEKCPSPPDSLANITGNHNIVQIKILATDTFNLAALRNMEVKWVELAFIKNLTITEGMIENPSIRVLDINTIDNFKISGRPFKALTEMTKIKIWRTKLEFIEKDLFYGLENLKNVYLNENHLELLPQGLFDDMTDLNFLQLEENRLKTLPRDIWKFNKKLRKIYLSNNCMLESLPENLFSNQENLKKIVIKLTKCRNSPTNYVNLPNDLFNNPSIEEISFNFLKTRELPQHLLRGCGNLRTFFLQSGKLEKINKELFLPTKKIRKIDLVNNRISSLDPETFQGLSRLTSLRLKMNNLTELRPDVLTDTTSLERLELQQNKLTTFHSDLVARLVRLQELNLSNNLLNTTILSQHLLDSNLKKIFLSNNKIRNIDFEILTQMRSLEHISVSNNELSDYLVFDQSLGVSRALTVDLSNNQIAGVKLLPQTSQSNSTSPPLVLKLEGNPLRCDCFAAEIKALSADENPRIDPDDYKCEEGKSLKNTPYSELLCYFDCFPGCLCEDSPHLRRQMIKCQDKKITEIPQYSNREDLSVFLNLEQNEIVSLPLAGLENVEELHLTGNKMTEVPQHILTPRLRSLSIDSNQLRHIPSNFIEKLQDKILENNLSVKLGNNPFQCSCSNVGLLEFVQEFREWISDHENITLDCQHSDNQQIIFLREEEICQPFELELIIIGLSLLIVASVMMIFCYVYRDIILILIFSQPWGRYLFSEDLLDSRKEYDVFLSYASQDSQYVEETLLAGLERPDRAEAGRYKCLIHSRDWAPGTAIPDQILQSVENSRRTLIVLSNNYLQSMWSNMEFQAAHVKTMEENIQVELLQVYITEIKL